jgi:hypothetical protein
VAESSVEVVIGKVARVRTSRPGNAELGEICKVPSAPANSALKFTVVDPVKIDNWDEVPELPTSPPFCANDMETDSRIRTEIKLSVLNM